MKVTFPRPDDGFRLLPCVVAGVDCVLITPCDIKTKFNEQNKIFRSSVWTLDGKPVSLGYRKFVNYGERPAFEPFDINEKGISFPRKIDGSCCHEDTKITTEDGVKTIKEICEKKYFGMVLGFNHETKRKEFTQIIAHSIRKNNNDWYELELENGQTVKLTGNHLVWLPKLNCYRRVDQLEINDDVLLEK